jgi:alpha-tubulin suppressor-like RCC1 family protein
MHACDIASGGIAWCWGLAGSEGRIGDGTIGNYTMSSTPVRVSGNYRFVQLSTFARHTCGITVNGSAYCCGTNSWGSLGSGTNIAQSPTPVPVAGGLTFKQISVGADHSCGVTTGNQAYCWGNGAWRQLGTGTSASTSTPVPVVLNQSIAQVAAGVSFSCALTTTGAAYCWGANTIGEIGDGGKIAYGNVYVTLPQAVVGGHSFRSISLGQHYACAVTTTGQGYCWGSDGGKLGSSNIGDTSTPRAVTGGFTFQQLAAGFGHACGVSTNAEVYCWGGNGNGQLGVVALNGTTVPVRPNGNMTGAEVSAAGIGTGSGAHTCAIAKDRLTVNCWGRNDYGQLGNGQTSQPTDRNYTASIVVGQKPLPKTF